jgi:hypothetical protein
MATEIRKEEKEGMASKHLSMAIQTHSFRINTHC